MTYKPKVSPHCHSNSLFWMLCRLLSPESKQLVVVEDLTKHPIYRHMPVVLSHGYRFYAGCALVASNDLRLGTLFVADRQPRKLSIDDAQLMLNLAALVVREIEGPKIHKFEAEKRNGQVRNAVRRPFDS